MSDAIKTFKGNVTHAGAIYGDRKIEYFNSIDCFLFPTKFECESWGIVLNEALASGLPVITTNRGSVQTLLGDRAGVIVDDVTRYVNEAVRQVEAWMDSPQDYCATSQAAIEQADYLHREAAVQLERVATCICSPAEAT